MESKRNNSVSPSISRFDGSNGKKNATESKLSKLEDFVARQYGRTANVVLADIDAGRQGKSLPQALEPGVIPDNRQLPAPSSQGRDRPIVHENKLKTVDGFRRRAKLYPRRRTTDQWPDLGAAPTCYNFDLLRANSGTSSTPNVNHFASHSKSSSINLPNSQESNEDDDKPMVEPSSLITESVENSRKRVRIDDIIDHQHDFRTPEKRSVRTKRGEAKIREPQETVGPRERGPVDYIKSAEEIKVPINLLDLLQNFPDLVKNFKKNPTRTSQKQKDKESKDKLTTRANLVDADENHS
ncbi:hypothetical protein K3495_g1138 [Podosphaera aphanis]|nr:hypothetical protein K3495_g1138 [Podosphaera aphanis]